MTSLRFKVTSHGDHVTFIGSLGPLVSVLSPLLGYLRSFYDYYCPPVSPSEPLAGQIKSLEIHFEAL